MKDLSGKILGKIKKENVQPYSRLHFIIHNFVIWSLFIFSSVLGSLACGVVIFQIRHTDWELYHYLNVDYGTFILINMPYFWLVFLLGFMGIAYFYCRRTERGYKCPAALVITASVIFSIAGGIVVYKVDLAERLETVCINNIGFYRKLQEKKTEIWMAPEKGLLAGTISRIISGNKFKLKDLKSRTWQMDVSHARWRGHLKAAAGLKIKIIGRMSGKNSFIVREIRPWQGRGWRRFFNMGR